MYVLSYFFGFLIACLAYFLYDNYFSSYKSFVNIPDKKYDYIIVGAGTAGCVLSARLSEEPNIKVLLIEAGQQMSFFTNIPLTATAAQQGPCDWAVKTTPQKYSSFGLINQTQFLPRGKGLGGSGQINFLMHGFGMANDYKEWRELGLESWSLDDLEPYFRKAFGTNRSEFDSRMCQWDEHCSESKAPMKLQQIDRDNELLSVFSRASTDTGNEKTTFRRPTATVDGGRRVSTFETYLKPALNRKNLHVLMKTSAVSIRFKNKSASSLYILQNGRQFNNIFVDKEIIVSAGAVKTPQLLMLSGIGPEMVLRTQKIKPVSFVEGLGHNLHDHMNMPIYVSIKKPISVTLSKLFTFQTVWDYLWRKEGLLSFPPLAGIEYTNNSVLMLFALGTSSERLLREVSNYKSKVFRETFRFHNASSSKEGFMFLASCAKPKSRGYVTLANIDISEQPVVNPNYLKDHTDVECIIQALRRAEELVKTPHFREIGAVIHWPRPERCRTLWIPRRRSKKRDTETPSDSFLECIIREVAVTGHHIGGTCPAPTVVDDFFKLRSVNGVRIVDASVIPTPVSLYPNSVIVGLAEKAADIIKYSNQ